MELFGLDEIDNESANFVKNLLITKPLNQFLKITNEKKVNVSPIKIESALPKVNIEDILAA